MFLLSPDESFHFELLRLLAHARYHGADVGEVLEATSHVKAGDIESYYSAFNALALRLNARADRIDSAKFPVSARDAYFSAATYFRAADFYIHGNADDPRINLLWKQQTAAFDKAIALLPQPGERLLLKGDGLDVPAIFYPAPPSGSAATKKPTIILGTGFDGSQEELLHVCGFAALERGYNVITYEGPGQPTVLREQGLGFIAEWEKAVSPVLDYLESRQDVDLTAIGLWGYSMVGWLALRAAAMDHRIAAVIAVDGVFDVFQGFCNVIPPDLISLFNLDGGDNAVADQTITGLLTSGKVPTSFRWGIEQGLWSFNTKSVADFLKGTRPMTLQGISDKIVCPVWVGSAADDQFFKGQPELVKQALGDRATLVELTAEDAAGNHCHVGAAALLDQKVFDWFHGVISK